MTPWVTAELTIPSEVQVSSDSNGFLNHLAKFALVKLKDLVAHLLAPDPEESLWPN